MWRNITLFQLYTCFEWYTCTMCWYHWSVLLESLVKFTREKYFVIIIISLSYISKYTLLPSEVVWDDFKRSLHLHDIFLWDMLLHSYVQIEYTILPPEVVWDDFKRILHSHDIFLWDMLLHNYVQLECTILSPKVVWDGLRRSTN